MNKIIISLIVLISTMTTILQAQVKNEVAALNNSKQYIRNCEPVIFQLFPTQDTSIFIKLNSRNGQMWQVQYNVHGSNVFETYLNSIPLVNKEKEANGRFTLYTTQDTFIFILLDQIDGQMWRVQYSTKPKNRSIIPMNLN